MSLNMSKLLEDWYSRPSGKIMLSSIGSHIDQVLERTFGYYLIQIGPANNIPLYSKSTIGKKVLISNSPGPNLGVISNFSELPLGSDCVDVVICQHLLEFSEQPHKSLREAQRVLTPQGHLFLMGFNPYSVTGLNIFGLKLAGSQLWSSCNLVNVGRLRDWLNLLGFEHITTSWFTAIPDGGNKRFGLKIKMI